MDVTILGSINVDLVAYTLEATLPKPGQTVFGSLFEKNYGGKGANQAVQAARMGVRTRLIGRVGDDDFGRDYVKHLHDEGVVTDLVDSVNASTGLAHIMVASSGENCIVIIPGANGKVNGAFLDAHYDKLVDTKVLLCQNEIPFDSTIAGLKAGSSRGVITIFNPAPAPTSDLDVFFEKLRFCELTYITPNETELANLVGRDQCVTDEEIELATKELLELCGCKNAIVTLGEKGCYHAQATGLNSIGTFYRCTGAVDAIVDTTGAGDSFLGTFAAHLSAGSPVEGAIGAALHVATLSVCSQGAQASYVRSTDIANKHRVPSTTA
jgi:ribokinase